MLLQEEMHRYIRHIGIPEIGVDGQEKLKNARVLVVGIGGLGSAAATYLATAGVGTIGIADFDVVDTTNIQRQILYSTKDVGKTKAEAAKQRLLSINPEIEVIKHGTLLSQKNALDIIKDYDIIIDGTDNPDAKYAINDACVQLRKADVSGSIFRFEGQVSIFVKGSCYRCLLPRPHNATSCAESGVLSSLPGIIGSIQATEAIKLIIGKGEPLIGRLLVFDALKMDFRKLVLKRNPRCSLCRK